MYATFIAAACLHIISMWPYASIGRLIFTAILYTKLLFSPKTTFISVCYKGRSMFRHVELIIFGSLTYTSMYKTLLQFVKPKNINVLRGNEISLLSKIVCSRASYCGLLFTLFCCAVFVIVIMCEFLINN